MKIRELIVIACLLPACNQANTASWEAEAEALLVRAQELECRRYTLHFDIQELWDLVVDSLDAKLPASVQPNERKNMLAVRNAPLIKMFKVFPKLDTAIQNLVEQAGMTDEKFADELRAVQAEIQANELEILQLLGELEKTSPKAKAQWQSAFDAARARPCEKDG
jgi:hypothetical protein